MRVIMAAANYSPVVACRRAKYNGDFRVPTPFGVHPLDYTVRFANAPRKISTRQ
jgi:hypothetical protein